MYGSITLRAAAEATAASAAFPPCLRILLPASEASSWSVTTKPLVPEVGPRPLALSKLGSVTRCCIKPSRLRRSPGQGLEELSDQVIRELRLLDVRIVGYLGEYLEERAGDSLAQPDAMGDWNPSVRISCEY